MKDISIFDVIGPNMIGPSSSHTAGALRIALLAYKIAEKDIKEAKFILYGSFAQTYKGHGTDRALLAGIMGFGTEDERIKNAFEYADKQGIKYSFETNETNKNVHPNTVEIIIKNSHGEEKSIMGESIGGGNVQIKQINGVDVLFTGKYSTIIVRQKDRKGVVAHITKALSDCEINIAFMRLYRTQKGETAYTIIEADQKIDGNVAKKIMECENIEDTTIIDV
ncbi:MAG: L-serine ammonia-lyase, iron-sulfur-dependent subunit beta [Proteocatella sp.]